MTEYPEGREVAWLAHDRNYCVGIFITAGYGPIPECIQSNVQTLNGEIEDIVLERLTERTQTRLLNSSGDTSSFESLARRGLFAYDWPDIGRLQKLIVYEQVAQPMQSMKIDDLPPELRELAKSVSLSEVDFSLAQPLAVHRYIPCIWP